MQFDDVIKNGVYSFYGVDANCFKLGSTVFEAVENPDDGYRSYLQSVEVVDDEKLIFFSEPLGLVRVEEVNPNPSNNDFNGYQLVDHVDGHIWLMFGTDDSHDYYPYFVFHYSPRII